MKTKFIEIHVKREGFDEMGIERLVNVAAIEQVIKVNDNTTFHLLSGKEFDVIESIEMIKNMINPTTNKDGSDWQ